MDKKGSFKIAIFCDNDSIITKTILPILKKTSIDYHFLTFDSLSTQSKDICLSDYIYLLIQISAENDFKQIYQLININANIPPICFLFEDYSQVNKNFIYSFKESNYLVYPLHKKEIQTKLINPVIAQADLIKKNRSSTGTIDIQSKDWFDFFTSFTFDGILIHDEGTIIDINDSLVRISGYLRNELIGKNIIQLVVCDEYKEIVYKNVKNEILTPYEIQIQTKNGEKHWVMLQGRKFAIGDRNYRIVAARDIHKEKIALLKLKETNDKIQGILDHTHNFIGLLTTEGILIETNQSSLDLIKAQKKDVINKPFHETPWWSHSKRIQMKLNEAIKKAAKGEFVRFETTHLDAEGNLLTLDYSLNPILNNKNEVIYIIPEGRDISIYKRARQLIQKKNILLQETEKRLEKTNKKLNELNKELILSNHNLNIALSELSDQQAKYYSLFEYSHDAIILMEEKCIIDCNKKFIQLFNITKKEIIGKTPMHLSPEFQKNGMKSIDIIGQKIKQVLHGESFRFNWTGFKSNGDLLEVEITLGPIYIQEKVLIQIICKDLTEKIQSKQALIESEKKFRTLAENSHDVIMRFDKKLRHLYVNPSVERETGIPAKEFIGKTHEELGFPKHLIKIWEDAIHFVFQKKTTHRVEFQMPKGMWIDWTLNPEFGENNEVVAVMTSARDISYIKNAEEELKIHKNNLENLVDERTREIRNLNNELIASNEELKVSNDALEEQKRELQNTLGKLNIAKDQLVQSEKMASLGILTAGIAHEINNPINFISSGSMGLSVNLEKIISLVNKYTHTFSSISDGQYKPTEQERIEFESALKATQRMQEIIEIGIQRTIEIINSLRSFSRMDNESLGTTDIHKLLDNTLIILFHQYKNRISIEKQYDNKLPQIECIQAKINQVFMNLLINAIQAIPEKGKIFIRTSYTKKEDTVIISIKDTGTGIPEEIIDKIFDPFFTTKNVGKGTGLGLSIVYGIIQQHFGDIEIKTKINEGTEFIVTLPVKSQGKK